MQLPDQDETIVEPDHRSIPNRVDTPTRQQRREARLADRVEAYQRGLIDDGVMCAACRHTSVDAGPYSDRAATVGGVCLALTDAGGWGTDDHCDCTDRFHGESQPPDDGNDREPPA